MQIDTLEYIACTTSLRERGMFKHAPISDKCLVCIYIFRRLVVAETIIPLFLRSRAIRVCRTMLSDLRKRTMINRKKACDKKL